MAYNPISFSRQLKPPGTAGATSSPMNVDEVDLPPGAPEYEGGPLANMPPRPKPSPTPPSLSTLAAGGNNHQEAWMAGQVSPTALPQQAPFSASEEDLPPGVGGGATYYGGPLAVPKPSPSPAPRSLNPDVAHFSWASAFDKAEPAY